ncbi:unnamed protein product [Mycena citricolor]|uniref:Uncharacterized protein n=1 Tax=Mycena citricolor TaxID=2018698 RepID=A0AAD2K1X5_9AGAR|nr:unnamed protein product [Mycena citricolor]
MRPCPLRKLIRLSPPRSAVAGDAEDTFEERSKSSEGLVFVNPTQETAADFTSTAPANSSEETKEAQASGAASPRTPADTPKDRNESVGCETAAQKNVTSEGKESSPEVSKGAEEPPGVRPENKLVRAVGQIGADIDAIGQSAAYSTVQQTVTDPNVQAIELSALNGVPALLDALQTISRIHPFVELAFLPFKLIYMQEMARRNKDQRRLILFGLIKDVMSTLVHLEFFTSEYAPRRTTRNGRQVENEIKRVCQEMKNDIEECYNVLNEHDNSRRVLQFLKASSWNQIFLDYGARFKASQERLGFAMHVENTVGVGKMSVVRILDPSRSLIRSQVSDDRTAGSTQEVGYIAAVNVSLATFFDF